MRDSLKADGLVALNGHAVAATPASLANYSFPEGRLKTLSDSTKIPVVLMACGSLSVLNYESKATFYFIDIFTAPRLPFSTFVRLALLIYDHKHQASSGGGTLRQEMLTRILCRSIRNGQRLYQVQPSRVRSCGRSGRYARLDSEQVIDFQAGYLSPVSDAYKKVSLSEDRHLFKILLKRPY